LAHDSIARIFSWAAGIVIVVGATALAFVWFVVPESAKDDFRRTHGMEEGIPERHLVPDGYRGWAIVAYNMSGRPELPVEDGVLVFRYSESGRLETSSPWNHGIKRKEFFTHGPAGQTALLKVGPNRRIWGVYDLSRVSDNEGDSGGSGWQSGFFVGTHEDFDGANKLAPYHLPPIGMIEDR